MSVEAILDQNDDLGAGSRVTAETFRT